MTDTLPTITWHESIGRQGVAITLGESGDGQLDIGWAVNRDGGSSGSLVPYSLRVGHDGSHPVFEDPAQLRSDIQEAVTMAYGDETAKEIDTALERGEFETGGLTMDWRKVAPNVELGSVRKILPNTILCQSNDIEGTFEAIVEDQPGKGEVNVEVHFETSRQDDREVLVEKSSTITFRPKPITDLSFDEWDDIKERVSQADTLPVTRSVISLIHHAEINAFGDEYFGSGEVEMDENRLETLENFSSRGVQKPTEQDKKHIESFSNRLEDNRNHLLAHYQNVPEVSSREDLEAWLSTCKTIQRDRLMVYSDILKLEDDSDHLGYPLEYRQAAISDLKREYTRQMGLAEQVAEVIEGGWGGSIAAGVLKDLWESKKEGGLRLDEHT